MKKMSKNKIIESAQKRDLRVKANFTLEEATLKAFQAECEKLSIPMSRILEALMREFISGETSI